MNHFPSDLCWLIQPQDIPASLCTAFDGSSPTANVNDCWSILTAIFHQLGMPPSPDDIFVQRTWTLIFWKVLLWQISITFQVACMLSFKSIPSKILTNRTQKSNSPSPEHTVWTTKCQKSIQQTTEIHPSATDLKFLGSHWKCHNKRSFFNCRCPETTKLSVGAQLWQHLLQVIMV